jgi:hypothetical protein
MGLVFDAIDHTRRAGIVVPRRRLSFENMVVSWMTGWVDSIETKPTIERTGKQSKFVCSQRSHWSIRRVMQSIGWIGHRWEFDEFKG